jgi:type I restriction enzyme S subunit
MGEWKEVQLSVIADVQTGPFGSQLHASDYVAAGVPVIMPNSIGPRMSLDESTMSFITEDDAERLARYRVREGDIVFSRRGDVDKCVYIDARKAGWFCGTGCLFARIIDTEVDPTFAAYQFDGPELKHWLRAHAVGTTMPNLNSKILSWAPVSVPSLPEQRAIASVLSSLDAKIDLLHRQNKTLEAMAETLFRQWFVEEAEEAWVEVRLDQLADIRGGKQLPTEECKITGLHAVYGANGIMGFAERHTHEGFVIAFGRVGANCGSLFWSHDGAWINNNASSIVPLKWPEYVLQALLAVDFVAKRTGSAQPFIPNNALAETEILLPSEEKCNRYCELVGPWRLKQVSNEKQIRSLTALRDTLLPKLMSGEVRVEEEVLIKD